MQWTQGEDRFGPPPVVSGGVVAAVGERGALARSLAIRESDLEDLARTVRAGVGMSGPGDEGSDARRMLTRGRRDLLVEDGALEDQLQFLGWCLTVPGPRLGERSQRRDEGGGSCGARGEQEDVPIRTLAVALDDTHRTGRELIGDDDEDRRQVGTQPRR